MEIMNIKILAGIAILIFAFIMGCSGNYANIKNQSGDVSKVTQKKLINNWSDYDIWFRYTVIVFDPKNDDKKILVGSNWGTVKDQEMWTEIVKENTTSDGNINPVWANYSMTGVREIWGPDNQFYGYVIHQQNDLVNAKVVDENTIRLFHRYAKFGGP
jgi:hypothetical protein